MRVKLNKLFQRFLGKHSLFNQFYQLLTYPLE